MGPSIKDPLELPCGLVLPNRLVKAAMAEGLAERKHLPGAKISRVYGKWGKGGWGALLTGNVQVDVRHLGSGGDLATREYSEAEQDALNAWKQYANACQENGTPAVAQICHPGRQSPRGAGERGLFESSIAPSAIPLDFGKRWAATVIRNIAFGTPQAMTNVDINRVIAQFVTCARVLAQCGFSGIEVHAAHGYLLSQFLSERSNQRDDQYGGSAERRARIILDIIHQIRKAVPKTFCVGIKLNSADSNSAEFEDTMTQVSLFVEAGVDFLEISGGSYEDPKMVGRGLQDEAKSKSTSTESREAFFLDFATQARKRFPDQILMLTGGFRTRKGIESALQSGVCDLVGIGRPAVLNADFPRLMMDDTVYSDQAKVVFSKVQAPFFAKLLSIKVLGGGAETQFFRDQIHRIAGGYTPRSP